MCLTTGCVHGLMFTSEHSVWPSQAERFRGHNMYSHWVCINLFILLLLLFEDKTRINSPCIITYGIVIIHTHSLVGEGPSCAPTYLGFFNYDFLNKAEKCLV